MVSMDSTEKMVHYLEKNKYDHMILYQKSSSNELWNDMNPRGLTHLVNYLIQKRDHMRSMFWKQEGV